MIGKAYDVRLRIVTELRRQGFEVKTYGDKAWPLPAHREKVYGADFRDVVASSSVNLATNLYHLIPGWTSIRVFLLLACGGFTLINAFPGIEEFFQNRKQLVWYESEEDVPELVAYWLNKPERRHTIAENGRQVVVDRFTMRHTAKQILKVCGL
jgi:spore maturation protein CgeB